MARFFLLRHAAAETKGAYCGSTDAQLSSLGQVQAKAVVEKVALAQGSCLIPANQRTIPYFDSKLSAVASSPLARCAGMAGEIAQACCVPLVTSLLLAEINFGAWEGLRFDEAGQKYPLVAEAILSSSGEVDFPEGEGLKSFYKRVKTAWEFLRESFPGQEHVVVSTHGGFIAASLLLVENKPLSAFWDISIPHASLTVIDMLGADMRVLAKGIPLVQ